MKLIYEMHLLLLFKQKNKLIVALTINIKHVLCAMFMRIATFFIDQVSTKKHCEKEIINKLKYFCIVSEIPTIIRYLVNNCKLTNLES